jgi:hypothetical protein
MAGSGMLKSNHHYAFFRLQYSTFLYKQPNTDFFSFKWNPESSDSDNLSGKAGLKEKTG